MVDSNSNSVQEIVGSEQTDVDGTRQALILFRPQTAISVMAASGVVTQVNRYSRKGCLPGESLHAGYALPTEGYSLRMEGFNQAAFKLWRPYHRLHVGFSCVTVHSVVVYADVRVMS